jgi:hypothetical protein
MLQSSDEAVCGRIAHGESRAMVSTTISPSALHVAARWSWRAHLAQAAQLSRRRSLVGWHKLAHMQPRSNARDVVTIVASIL